MLYFTLIVSELKIRINNAYTHAFDCSTHIMRKPMHLVVIKMIAEFGVSCGSLSLHDHNSMAEQGGSLPTPTPPFLRFIISSIS